MPRCSVIIPAYNAARYLRGCLDSVLGQTQGDIQVVCVNDGSTDDTAAILAEYAADDSRLKIVSQKNMGLAAARRRGLEEATSEWIAYCDADDWMERSAIAEMTGAAGRESADCVCCGLIREGADGRSVRRPFDREGPSDTYNALVTKLFRRQLLEDLAVDTSVKLGEDLMVTAQALRKARRITVMDAAFYHYRENGASVTHVQDGRKRVEDLARVGEILRTAMPEPEYADLQDRVTRDALLLWIRYRLFDRKLWRTLRARMSGGLLSDPRHGLLKKGALACAACLFD